MNIFKKGIYVLVLQIVLLLTGIIEADAQQSLPYTQGWEGGSYGNWTQPTYDDNDWLNHTGGTTTNYTGPSSAREGSHYIYCESTNAGNGDVFALESPTFDFSSALKPKIKFDYHMRFNGASDGTLKLDVSTDGGSTWTTEWSKTGKQLYGWQDTIVSLSSYAGNTNVMLRFHFTVGTANPSYEYDVALDRINVAELKTIPYNQGWENGGIGSWEQPTYDDKNWSNDTGNTSSGNSGPGSANEGSHYIHCDTSALMNNSDVFALESPTFDFSSVMDPSIIFDYYMLFDGEKDGTLKLDVSTDGGSTWTTEWSKTGEQGSNWQLAVVSLTSYAGYSSVRVRFHFTVGSAGASFDYDAAIDYVRVWDLKSAHFFEDFDPSGIWPDYMMRSSSDVMVSSPCSSSGLYSMRIDGISGENAMTPAVNTKSDTNIISFDWRSGCHNDPENIDCAQVEYWDGSSWNILNGWPKCGSYTSWSTFQDTIVTTNLDFKLRFYVNNGSGAGLDDWNFDNIEIKAPTDTTAPTVITQNDTAFLDSSGQVGIMPSDIDSGSYDNKGIDSLYLSLSNFNCPDIGTQTITLTVTDTNGNSDSATAKVTVKDTINPVITPMSDTVVCNGPFTFSMPTATDNCGAIVKQTSGPVSGDVLTSGVYTFSFVAVDSAGNTDSTHFTATVSEPDVDLGPDTTICHDDSLKLTADSGYVDYSWSTGEASISINVDSLSMGLGTHTISLTVTDSLGCTSTDTVTIEIEDCTTAIPEYANEGEVNIFPNPNSGSFDLSIKGIKDKRVKICVYNFNGQKIECEKIEDDFSSKFTKHYDLSGQAKGLYLIRITGKHTQKIKRMIIQ